MKRVSLVVPFFNEESVLAKKIPEMHRFALENLKNFEIFFVDDGSSDSSNTITRSYIRRFSNLHIITHKKNLGRGAAISSGFRKATGNYVGYIDCDLEIKLSYILQALRKLEQYDVVIASKFQPGSRIETSLFRRISSILYNKIVQIILRSRVADHQAGLKFFRKDTLDVLLPLTKEQVWLWDTEILYLAQRMQYKVFEIPIKIRYGYRNLRASFFLDFLKLPFILLQLKNKVNTRLRLLVL